MRYRGIRQSRILGLRDSGYPAQPTLQGTGSPSARPRIIFPVGGTRESPLWRLMPRRPPPIPPRHLRASCAPFWAFVGVTDRCNGKRADGIRIERIRTTIQSSFYAHFSVTTASVSIPCTADSTPAAHRTGCFVFSWHPF